MRIHGKDMEALKLIHFLVSHTIPGAFQFQQQRGLIETHRQRKKTEKNQSNRIRGSAQTGGGGINELPCWLILNDNFLRF